MKRYIKFLVALFIFIVIVLINQTNYATTGITTKETVRLREKASTDSKTIMLLSIDEEIEIISEDGDWYKVQYKDEKNTYTGYIRNDMLKVDGKDADSVNKEEEEDDDVKEQENSEIKNDDDKDSVNQVNDEKQEDNQISDEEFITENTVLKIKNEIGIKILPIITSSQIDVIEKDTEIMIKEIVGKWCYIETDEQNGWALISKIEKQDEDNKEDEKNKEEIVSNDNEKESEKEENKKEDTKSETKTNTNTTKKMYVSSTTVNVREKANTSSKIVKQLGINTEVIVVETVDSTWSKVKIDNTYGYIATKYLSDKKTTVVTSRGSDESRVSQEETKISEDDEKEEEKKDETENDENTEKKVTGYDIVEYAKTLLGKKYVRGGTSPTTGFDCSGYTQYVYKHFGYSLSRTSSAQRSNGKSVSKSNLIAGDIVCFDGHVGIYIGENNFIHAENPANGVKISSLSEKYYTNNYITARRIIY